MEKISNTVTLNSNTQSSYNSILQNHIVNNIWAIADYYLVCAVTVWTCFGHHSSVLQSKSVSVRLCVVLLFLF